MRGLPARVVLATVLALLAAQPATAQNALTFYGGYRGGGSFQQTDSAGATTAANLTSGGVGALSLDWPYDSARNGQLFASGQRSTLQLAPGSAGSLSSVPLKIGYLHVGGSNFFDGIVGQGAYLAGGLGATLMTPQLQGLRSEVRPSMSLALGYERQLASALSLRLEARGYATLINSSGGFFCSGGCVVVLRGDTLLQAEALIGLSLRF
jgi:hypothetical protein